MPKTWGEFYEPADINHEYTHQAEVHRPFLERILELQPRRVLEAGCGTAVMSAYLAGRGVETVAIDLDPDVIRRASVNLASLGTETTFLRGDIFRMPFSRGTFDVVFSQGVAEHFTDGAVQAMVEAGLSVGSTVLLSVPSRYYHSRDFGDERLLTDGQWAAMLKGSGIVRSQYYCYQRRKRYLMRRVPMMVMVEISPAEPGSH